MSRGTTASARRSAAAMRGVRVLMRATAPDETDGTEDKGDEEDTEEEEEEEEAAAGVLENAENMSPPKSW